MSDADRALASLKEAWRFELLQDLGMEIRREGGPDNDEPVWVFVDREPRAEVTSYDFSRWRWAIDGDPWVAPKQPEEVPF